MFLLAQMGDARVKIRKPDVNTDEAGLREDALTYVQLGQCDKSWKSQPEDIAMIKGIWGRRRRKAHA